jgi:hypothetical protein
LEYHFSDAIDKLESTTGLATIHLRKQACSRDVPDDDDADESAQPEVLVRQAVTLAFTPMWNFLMVVTPPRETNRTTKKPPPPYGSKLFMEHGWKAPVYNPGKASCRSTTAPPTMEMLMKH